MNENNTDKKIPKKPPTHPRNIQKIVKTKYINQNNTFRLNVKILTHSYEESVSVFCMSKKNTDQKNPEKADPDRRKHSNIYECKPYGRERLGAAPSKTRNLFFVQNPAIVFFFKKLIFHNYFFFIMFPIPS